MLGSALLDQYPPSERTGIKLIFVHAQDLINRGIPPAYIWPIIVDCAVSIPEVWACAMYYNTISIEIRLPLNNPRCCLLYDARKRSALPGLAGAPAPRYEAFATMSVAVLAFGRAIIACVAV